MLKANFPPVAVQGSGQLYARFVTSMGNIIVALEEEGAPNTVKNFVGLATGTQEWEDPETDEVKKGVPYYDGTVFHRVIPDFMIQGGDPTGSGRGGPGYRFADEFNPSLRHSGPGILSMANAGAGTNGSQFFITERATPHLNDKHSVFGRTVVGLDLIGKIARAGSKTKLERLEIFRSPTPPAS